MRPQRAHINLENSGLPHMLPWVWPCGEAIRACWDHIWSCQDSPVRWRTSSEQSAVQPGGWEDAIQLSSRRSKITLSNSNIFCKNALQYPATLPGWIYPFFDDHYMLGRLILLGCGLGPFPFQFLFMLDQVLGEALPYFVPSHAVSLSMKTIYLSWIRPLHRFDCRSRPSRTFVLSRLNSNALRVAKTWHPRLSLDCIMASQNSWSLSLQKNRTRKHE